MFRVVAETKSLLSPASAFWGLGAALRIAIWHARGATLRSTRSDLVTFAVAERQGTGWALMVTSGR